MIQILLGIAIYPSADNKKVNCKLFVMTFDLALGRNNTYCTNWLNQFDAFQEIDVLYASLLPINTRLKRLSKFLYP